MNIISTLRWFLPFAGLIWRCIGNRFETRNNLDIFRTHPEARVWLSRATDNHTTGKNLPPVKSVARGGVRV